jgi:DNA invertase Pin-like site-specific DNA recombinase
MTALYLRVSTDGQRLDAQERELRRYCKRAGWKGLAIYRDKQAGADASRPAFEGLMQAVRQGRFERVVCYKLDRLGRSLSHLALVIEEMTRLHVPLICTSQGIDTSENSVAGKFQVAVLMAVAEFERGIIRERVKSGLESARERGVRIGRPRTLDAHRDTVLTLKRRGWTVRRIARALALPVSSTHTLFAHR